MGAGRTGLQQGMNQGRPAGRPPFYIPLEGVSGGMGDPSALDRLVADAREDPEVLAVVLFGSTIRDPRVARDVDVCLVLVPPTDAKKSSLTRLGYLSRHDLDVQVFQQLPLQIRQRVLQEGKVLHCRDEDALYELAARTIKEITYYRPAYNTYLEGVRAGS